MRLLFDENLSPQLGRLLSVEFPGSLHLRATDVLHHSDVAVRAFAQAWNFTIVTRDFDFVELVDALGAPPNVIYFAEDNLSCYECAERLRRHKDAIYQAFEKTAKSVYVIPVDPQAKIEKAGGRDQ